MTQYTGVNLMYVARQQLKHGFRVLLVLRFTEDAALEHNERVGRKDGVAGVIFCDRLCLAHGKLLHNLHGGRAAQVLLAHFGGRNGKFIAGHF